MVSKVLRLDGIAYEVRVDRECREAMIEFSAILALNNQEEEENAESER